MKRLAALLAAVCASAWPCSPLRAESPRAAGAGRTAAPWMANFRAVVVDLGQLEHFRKQGWYQTPTELADHLASISGGRLDGIVFYTWPGYLFPAERWDAAGQAGGGRFDVPGFVNVCHARGLKVVAMFNGRHYAVAEDGRQLYAPSVNAKGETSSPQGKEYTGAFNRPAASFYSPEFARSLDEFCANSARAGFDALYLVEYNLPRDDLSPPALAYFKARTGIDLSPAALGDLNHDGQVDGKDSWRYIQDNCLAEWREARNARLVEFISEARRSANSVRPVPFGVLTAFGSSGREPRLWQEEALMGQVLPEIDFAGIYCRWFHWKVPPSATLKTALLIRRLDPAIPLFGELYVGSQSDGFVPIGDFRKQADVLRSQRLGYYLWLAGLEPARFSYAAIPQPYWEAVGEPGPDYRPPF